MSRDFEARPGALCAETLAGLATAGTVQAKITTRVGVPVSSQLHNMRSAPDELQSCL